MRNRALADEVRTSMTDLAQPQKVPSRAATPSTEKGRGPSPGQGAAPAVSTPPPVMDLASLPRPVLLRIIHLVAPHLRTSRNVSPFFRTLVADYVQSRVKRHKDKIEEAECWGRRAPTLCDIVHLDPLAVAAIVENQCRMVPVEPVHSSQESVVGFGSGGGGGGAGSVVGVESRKSVGLEGRRGANLQKRLFAAIRAALDGFEDGNWPAVKPLCDAVRRRGLQYVIAGSEAEPTESTDRTSVTSPNGLRTAKDPTWLRMNSECFLLSIAHGHTDILPPLLDLADPHGTLSNAVDISVRSQLVPSLVCTLTTARLLRGAFWPCLGVALDAFLAAERCGKKISIDVVVVVLDGLFNDPLGPWKYCGSRAGWGCTAGQLEDEAGNLAQELVIKGEECAKVYGLAWHRLSTKGEFAVVAAGEVGREIRSRLKVM
ncbi:hypothetical protein HK104_000019 [Borealophlyctis nickersoniae]|nr:hypothetical protein HK104_000019 [Borealophlyctis nickersoniae]